MQPRSSWSLRRHEPHDGWAGKDWGQGKARGAGRQSVGKAAAADL